MSEETIKEMESVLNLQKKLHNSEGPPSYDLRMDRLKRLKEMLLKYSEEILETITVREIKIVLFFQRYYLA